MTRAGLAWVGTGLSAALMVSSPGVSVADEPEAEEVGPYPGTVSWQTDYSVRDLVTRLQRAAEANGLTVVATAGATARDGGAPANQVLLLTRNEDAIKVVQADTLAGMEMPIRIFVLEGAKHHASVIYRTPSSIFALYDNPKLDALAADLDQVFAKLVDDAIGAG
jgi:uncharacterized protein (DUF302 family)